MKNINNFITEKLKISGNSKIIVYKYYPKSSEELKELIENIIKTEGGDVDLNNIDTSQIYDMHNLFLFKGNEEISNIKIDKWNVSRVKNMSNMFAGCGNFNCDLSNWDVSQVKNMSGMFYKCLKFNSDISKWDVSKVEDMEDMFISCKKFDQDLSKWNVSKVKSMIQMFRNCESFTGNGLSKWDISNCKYMSYMFYKCLSFTENLENWNINENIDIENMFTDCKRLYKKPKWYWREE